jgi:hypothetical protein
MSLNQRAPDGEQRVYEVKGNRSALVVLNGFNQRYLA